MPPKKKEVVEQPQQAPKRLDPPCIVQHPESRGKLMERKRREWLPGGSTKAPGSPR